MEQMPEPQPKRENPFIQLCNDYDALIQNEYQEKPRPGKQARDDAVQFAIASLSTDWYQSIFSPDDNEREWAKEDIERWTSALEETKEDKWDKMKDALQEEGRTGFQASQQTLGVGELLGKNLEDSATESEARGKAFINLANSLI